jgi:hypothetical protein
MHVEKFVPSPTGTAIEPTTERARLGQLPLATHEQTRAASSSER